MRLLVPLLVVCLSVGCVDRQSGGGATTATTRLPTRDELRTKLIGKTEAAVIAAVGRPDRTNAAMWSYHDLCYDPVSGKTDGWVFVWFGRDGTVSKIDF